MKFRDLAPYLLLAISLVYIFRQQKDPQVFFMPPKENAKVISNPMPIILRDTLTIAGEQIIRVKTNPVNIDLLEKYTKLKDSISKLDLYKDAITERTYKEEVKDSLQTIEVTTVVLGTLKEQMISYKTNPIKVEIKSSDRKKSVFIGVYSQLPTELINPSVGLSASIVSKKTMITIGYDTQKRLMLGTSIKLF